GVPRGVVGAFDAGDTLMLTRWAEAVAGAWLRMVEGDYGWAAKALALAGIWVVVGFLGVCTWSCGGLVFLACAAMWHVHGWTLAVAICMGAVNLVLAVLVPLNALRDPPTERQ